MRDRRNPLFPVNYIDRELRKDLAEHVRETVRFARNVNHCMERLWVYLLDHNVYKRFRINDRVGVERSHADEAGASRAVRTRAGAMRLIQRQASRGEVDLEQVREQLGVATLIREVTQYLPGYALD